MPLLRPWLLSAVALTGFCCSTDVSVGTSLLSAAEPAVSRGRWELLHQSRRQRGEFPLPEKGPLKGLTELNLKGVQRDDPNHLGVFAINGDFGLRDGVLTRTTGRNAAVQLAEDAQDFEIEAQINAEGTGGWFWLLGWKDGHGYAVYNVTLRKSGSPWMLSEFRGFEGIEESLQEFNRFEWRGPQPLKLTVVDQQLSLQVGTAALARNIELPNYNGGAIILGTYDTQYGPRELFVQTARMRRLTVKQKD